MLGARVSTSNCIDDDLAFGLVGKKNIPTMLNKVTPG